MIIAENRAKGGTVGNPDLAGGGQGIGITSHLCSETEPLACLKASPDGCPRLRVSGGFLSLNGEIALGYLELGYRPSTPEAIVPVITPATLA